MVFLSWLPGFLVAPLAGRGSFPVRCSGGVPCLFPLLLRPLWFAPLALGLRPGLARRLAFLSAPRAWRGRVLWRWFAFLRSLRLLAFPGRGVRVVALAFARFAPSPLRLVCRPRGVSPFRLRRRPPWSVAVAPRARWRPCSPPVAALRRLLWLIVKQFFIS